jgi:hypothetical protein
VAPGRCREIPEANNPDRIVLRQVALVKRYAYIQQFASSEDPRWMHSHQWHYMFALGLWGGYTEVRPNGWSRFRTAPYAYVMDQGHIHHVQCPGPGHTSLFVGLFRQDSLKHYFPHPALYRRTWTDHVKKMVARI